MKIQLAKLEDALCLLRCVCYVLVQPGKFFHVKSAALPYNIDDNLRFSKWKTY